MRSYLYRSFCQTLGAFSCRYDFQTMDFADPEFKENIKDFKVAYIGEEEPEGNYLEFYKMLGIEKEQLIHIEKPARFQKYLFQKQDFDHVYGIQKNIRECLI